MFFMFDKHVVDMLHASYMSARVSLVRFGPSLWGPHLD